MELFMLCYSMELMVTISPDLDEGMASFHHVLTCRLSRWSHPNQSTMLVIEIFPVPSHKPCDSIRSKAPIAKVRCWLSLQKRHVECNIKRDWLFGTIRGIC